MIQKTFESIHLQDIKDLIENQIAENKTLEYKSLLNLNKDAEKKEFLYDISSFANATGGDLLFGITEGKEKGLPGSLEGIDGNIDVQCGTMENMIRDSIKPRIMDIRLKSFPLENGKAVLLFRIPKSLNAPHQVTLQGVDRFYSRSNNGKYKMDVSEIGQAFLQSSKAIEKIKDFIKSRTTAITANDTPVQLEKNPKIILHIVPLQSIVEGANIISNQDLNIDRLNPLGFDGYDFRFNLDGLLNFKREFGNIDYTAYVQQYRHGIIETVNADLLREYDQKKLISVSPGFSVEGKIIQFADDALKLTLKRGIQTPVYLFLHFINIKGYDLYSERLRRPFSREKGIDREFIQFPEILVHNYTGKVDSSIKPWFETLWNACGYEQCLSYDANANFTGF